MNRRNFIQLAAAALLRVSVGSSLFANAALARHAADLYGPLRAPDANGLMMPAGFRSRVVATGGEIVPGTSFRWHAAADGGACFATADGYVYVSNSELNRGKGGVSALRFDADGRIVDAYSVCTGTSLNCAGGATPWGTWLSCEETPLGQVYECDPLGERPAVARPALGVFQHEAVAVDPRTRTLYLTEDQATSLFYRFTPTRWEDLSEGKLEAAALEGESVRWVPVRDARAQGLQTRMQLPHAARFNRGEGIAYSAGHVFFSTTGDHRIWDLDVAQQTLRVLHDGSASGSPIDQPDNLAVSPAGDLIVAEDPGDLELVLLTPDGEASPILRLSGQTRTELTGPAFDPSGTRLYFSSQRGGRARKGITYEISLPDAPGLAASQRRAQRPAQPSASR